MQSAYELELPQLPIETSELAADPTPYFAHARRQHPWLARCAMGFVITEYHAMREMLQRDDKLRLPNEQMVAVMRADGTGWGRFTNEMIAARSGADHARLRNSVTAAFTPRFANGLRQEMRIVVSDLLDQWAPKGEFDFAEFASYFPVRIMFSLIGGDPEVIPSIRSSLETQGSSFSLDPARMPEVEAAYQVLWDFVDGLIAERSGQGRQDDLLDILLAAHDCGALDDVELRHMLIVLFGAGYDTSKNQLTLLMHAMLGNLPMWRRCAEDRPYCDKVVDEALRHASPVNTFRRATEEFEYRGVVFPKDSVILLPIGISGRDPTAFARPESFDPERADDNRSIAFGRGMHICLGQFLARAQLQEGAHLIAQRITNPRLAGLVTWRPFHAIWGIKNLPIAFDRADRRPDTVAANLEAG